MSQALARSLKAAMLVALPASSFLIHLSLVRHGPRLLPAAIVCVQVCVLLGIVLTYGRVKGKWPIAIGLASLWVYAASRFGVGGLTVSSALPHAAIHIALLSVFAPSLMPGREPVVTSFIRQVRGPLPGELVRYGRHVTLAWCSYFSAQLAISLGLLLFAPLPAWSFFVNVLNLPLLFGMFLCEYLYRRIRFRHLPRSRLTDMANAVFSWRAAESSTTRSVPPAAA